MDNKLGDWTNCRSLFRHLCELDLGVLLDYNNGNWWTDYSKAALSSIGDYRTLEDRVEDHIHWIFSG